MDQEREMPRPGEFYRHFKDKRYQIIAIAVHSETGERMVVYQALYGEFQIWVRPLSMFLETVDREKYPDAKQKFRFERIVIEAEEAAEGRGVKALCDEDRAGDAESVDSAPAHWEEQEAQINPLLGEFFDADEYSQKLECLSRLGGRITQKDLDLIYVVMDMKPQAGDLTDQLRAVRSQLLMLQKYDGERLR